MTPKIKIPQLSEPADTPPNHDNNQGNNSHDMGFNIIKSIYDVFLIKTPIAFSVLVKYKKKLDLQIDAPWLYYPALVISVLLDIFLALIVNLVIAILVVVIMLSFMRGIGIFDWLPQILLGK